MMSFKEQLREFLGDCEEKKIAVLGIGSEIRGDDAVGLEIVGRLEEYPLRDVLLLKTETVPESFTSVLRKFNPTHILMIDAAHLGGEPGEAKIIPTQMICDVCVSTHKLPLTVLANYLSSKVTLVGIQPRSIAFGTSITRELKAAATKIAATIYEAISQGSCDESDADNSE
jgi:hydrogenase 3 maturation protease